MFSKVYSFLNRFLKENSYLVLGLICFSLVINIPLPYYVHTTGGIINISDKVIVEKEYLEVGSLNLSYVTEVKGNVMTVLLAMVIPNWDLIKSKEVKLGKETVEEVDFRSKLFLEEANQNAVFLAYQAAEKEIKIKKGFNHVVYIDDLAETDLKIKDKILKVNDLTINSVIEYNDIVSQSKIGDTLKLLVLTNNNQEVEKKIKVINYLGKKITGIYFVSIYEYETNPKIEFNFKKSESGSSGGLMTALSIYNKLTKTDITKGKKIVGTGAIDQEGNVEEISGLAYKLAGSVKEKAEIFLVPSGENYQEAMKLKKEKNYNISIVGVNTFQEALNYLNNM